MPRFWAGCIRVTHPCATLGQVLLPNLPSGLHVLGLPLAFILSQDQTLHSIIFRPRCLTAPSAICVCPWLCSVRGTLRPPDQLRHIDPSRHSGARYPYPIYSMNVLKTTSSRTLFPTVGGLYFPAFQNRPLLTRFPLFSKRECKGKPYKPLCKPSHKSFLPNHHNH